MVQDSSTQHLFLFSPLCQLSAGNRCCDSLSAFLFKAFVTYGTHVSFEDTCTSLAPFRFAHKIEIREIYLTA